MTRTLFAGEIFKKCLIVLIYCCLITGVLILSTVARSADDANTIVSKADLIRAPKGSYQVDATIENYEGAKKKSTNTYRIYVGDLDHVLVEFLSPPSERGKSLLMLGNDLWIYLPRVKRPVRIPLQQRLLGNVANGDMTRANFSEDYNSTITGEALLQGQASTVLDLVAKSDTTTYNRVKYWVNKTDNRPVKAEYFTVSGKSLKTSVFEDFRTAAGAVRPMRLVFQDTAKTKNKSKLIFKNMVSKKFSPRMFTKEHMKTLE